MDNITENDLNMDYIDNNSSFNSSVSNEQVHGVPIQDENIFNQQNNYNQIPEKSINDVDDDMDNNSVDSATPSSYAGSDLTPEEEERKKKTLLLKLKRLQKRGYELSRAYTIDSPLEDIQAEVESIKREANLEEGTGLAKTGLVFLTTAVEMANRRFDPFDIMLDGWSGQVKEDVDGGKYDEVMEDLYDKYYDSIPMTPEAKLALMITKSAVEFHVSNTIVKKMFKDDTNINKVFEQNPNIKTEIMNAVNKTDIKDNIYNELGMKNEEPIKQVREMNAPVDVDDILEELEKEDVNTQQIKKIKEETSKDGVLNIDW